MTIMLLPTWHAVWEKEEDAAYFAKRADYYKNLFDTETQFMRPRKADGTWKAPFNPSALGHSESIGEIIRREMHGNIPGTCNMTSQD